MQRMLGKAVRIRHCPATVNTLSRVYLATLEEAGSCRPLKRRFGKAILLGVSQEPVRLQFLNRLPRGSGGYMSSFSRRVSRFFLSGCLFISAASLHAVTVHGTVTDPLGQPVVGAVVALVQNGKVIVSAQAGADGTYQISSATSGRFYVLASGRSFRQLVTQSFYSDKLGSVEQNVVLEPEWVRQSVVVTAT